MTWWVNARPSLPRVVSDGLFGRSCLLQREDRRFPLHALLDPVPEAFAIPADNIPRVHLHGSREDLLSAVLDRQRHAALRQCIKATLDRLAERQRILQNDFESQLTRFLTVTGETIQARLETDALRRVAWVFPGTGWDLESDFDEPREMWWLARTHLSSRLEVIVEGLIETIHGAEPHPSCVALCEMHLPPVSTLEREQSPRLPCDSSFRCLVCLQEHLLSDVLRAGIPELCSKKSVAQLIGARPEKLFSDSDDDDDDVVETVQF